MSKIEFQQVEKLFSNLSYDLKEQHSNTMPLKLEIKSLMIHSGSNNSFIPSTFLKFIEDKRDKIIKTEEQYNFKTKIEASEQLELAIKYIKYYETNNIYIPKIQVQKCSMNNEISLLRIILNIYIILKNKQTFQIFFDERRFELFTVIAEYFINIKICNETVAKEIPKCLNQGYSSMIVTDSSDLHSASDVLAAAFQFNSTEWIIRSVYVQENIFEKFIALVTEKLRKFDSNYSKDSKSMDALKNGIDCAKKMGLKIITHDEKNDDLKPSIIIGSNRTYFDNPNEKPLLMILCNKFRTVKECISFINKEAASTSVSIWTENISLAYEFVEQIQLPTIWLNCHGKFNPKIPFNFSDLSLFMINEMPKLNENLNSEIPFKTLRFGFIEMNKTLHFQCYEWKNNKVKVCYDEKSDSLIVPSGEKTIVKVTKEDNEKLTENGCNFLFPSYKTVVTQFGVTFGN